MVHHLSAPTQEEELVKVGEDAPRGLVDRGDDDDALRVARAPDGGHDELRRGGVQSGRGLVEEEDPRVREKLHACQRSAMFGTLASVLRTSRRR